MNPATVNVEVWPLAADSEGVWLVDGLIWTPHLPIMAGSEPHAHVEETLMGHGVTDASQVLTQHSTSWRYIAANAKRDGAHDRRARSQVILTYATILAVPKIHGHEGFVRDTWPRCLPITPDLATHVGPPPVHAAAAPPTVRDVDVLYHALRHFAFLLGTWEGKPRDAEFAAALAGTPWREALAPLEPALAGLYDQEHPEAERERHRISLHRPRRLVA